MKIEGNEKCDAFPRVLASVVFRYPVFHRYSGIPPLFRYQGTEGSEFHRNSMSWLFGLGISMSWFFSLGISMSWFFVLWKNTLESRCPGLFVSVSRCHGFMVLESRCRGFLVLESQCRGHAHSKQLFTGHLHDACAKTSDIVLIKKSWRALLSKLE